MANAGITASEIVQLRRAGIPVPKNRQEVKALLNEAERDKGGVPLEEASREIRKRLKIKHGKKQSA